MRLEPILIVPATTLVAGFAGILTLYLQPARCCAVLRVARRCFGINIASECIGSWLALLARHQYKPLPCCVAAAATAGTSQPGVESESSSPTHACDAIRLLRVVSADDVHGVECSLSLRCHFEGRKNDDDGDKNDNDTTPVAECEPYYCLSYTWGEPFEGDVFYKNHRSFFESRFARTGIPSLFARLAEFVRAFLRPSRYFLILDDRIVPVEPNLWSAFLHLASTGDKELQAIWIDAVCINQLDTDEKDTQVAAMHRIYRSCAGVSAWLGPEDPARENLDRVVAMAAALREPMANVPGFSSEILDEPAAMAALAQFGFEDWFQVSVLLRRNYFFRMWIFQEIISAPDITLSCGTIKFSWDDLCHLSRGLNNYGNDALSRDPRLGSWAGKSANVAVMNHYRALYRGTGLRRQFGPLILSHSRSEYRCGNARDMLYAHVGVCAYDGIKPQYKSSVVQVYTEFWFGVLKRLPTGISFLTAVEDRSTVRPLSRWCWKWLLFPWPRSEKELLEDETTLPSWVPNFHKPLEPMSLTLHYGSGTFNATRGFGDDDENDDDDQGTAADSKFVARHIALDPHLNAITLKGYYVDTIRASGESGAEIWEINDISRLLTLLLETLQEPTAERRPYGCTRGVFEAYWHCMAVQADVGNDGDWPPAPSRRADCRDWLRHTLALSLNATRFAGVVLAWPPALRRISALPNWRLSPNYAAFSRLRAHLDAEARLGRLPPEEVADCLVPLPGEVDRHLYHYTNRMRRRLRVLRGDAVGDETPLLDVEEDADNGGADLGYGDVVDASVFGDVSLKKRRLFATRGGYLGKGTQALREGDEIWLLKGAEVPFILRKVEGTDRHRLVGHAYVHGIMYGEIAEKLTQGVLRTVVLE